jgi:phage terminase large subunit-like protein
LIDTYASQLDAQQQAELIECLEILADDQKYNKFKNYFPDEGEYNRALYPKHIEFFGAGNKYTERGFIAGNRVGKSEAGSYEVTCHATGMYPEWWEGLRFNRPVLIWVGGDTATTLRDIVQKKLLGEISDTGSGMIPKDSIVEYKTRRNVPDAIETIRIKHITGGVSTIVLKSYEQGRVSWQGAEVDFIWLDEEPPQDVYGEALIRLMTTNGSLIMTFTPLSGLTEVVLSFLDNSQETDSKDPKWVTICGWKDVPHISEEMKAKMLAATPPQLREARSEGKPTVGEGLVYPVDPKNITVDDFQIPKHFTKLYGMDVGWNNTACCFGAWDKDNDVIYIYSEHKQGQAEPVIHAKAIKARGEWIKGVIDPAARGRSQIDGQSLYTLYRKEGLKIYPANNAVEAGIFNVWERLTSGRLKVFKSCTALMREMSLYHRDTSGKIAKTNDHLLDALRYLLNAEPQMWSYPQQIKEREKVTDIRNYMQAMV